MLLLFVSPHTEIVPTRDIHAGPLGFISPAVLLLSQRFGEAESSEIFVGRVIDYGHALTAWERRSVASYHILEPGIENRLENVRILPGLYRFVYYKNPVPAKVRHHFPGALEVARYGIVECVVPGDFVPKGRVISLEVARYLGTK